MTKQSKEEQAIVKQMGAMADWWENNKDAIEAEEEQHKDRHSCGGWVVGCPGES